MKNVNNRSSAYPIDDIFLKRYSPRALSGEAITNEELLTVLEAGRWAPSSMNAQPWRFIYGLSGTPEFDKILSFLLESNQIWAQKSSALILILSKHNLDNGDFSVLHSFDTGAACQNMALQATMLGLTAHAMGGIKHDLIKEQMLIPEGYTVEAVLSIGKHGRIEDLPEKFHAREKPSDRKMLEEVASEGVFKN